MNLVLTDNGSVELSAGDEFTLDAEDAATPGNRHRVGVSYPGLQKRIIQTALKHNRVVATATQMMQSKIFRPAFVQYVG
jgi:pyruvate kinase